MPYRRGGLAFLIPTGRNRKKLLAKLDAVQNDAPAPAPPKVADVEIPEKNTNIAQEEFDEYGAELEPAARVWKTYVKEADKFDVDQVDEWNSSLDVTLIFAALFTAICTAFVVESSKALKEDWAEASAHRLDQIASVLLVVANISDRSQINPAHLEAPSASKTFSPRPLDVCVNALWFFSLILSASIALISMLAKEWCYRFSSGRTGDHWSQTKRRQQRWEGIEKWKMEQVVTILPSFIHLSFLSFAIALCIYLGDLNRWVSIPVTCVTFGSIFVYAASTLLPLVPSFSEECPYGTSVSRLVQRLKKYAERPEYRNNSALLKGDEDGSRETHSIAVKALAWLIKTSENPKSTDIALQAIAGAVSYNVNSEERQLLQDLGADKMIARRLIGLVSYSNNYEKTLELYTRARAYCQPPSSESAPASEESERERATVGLNGELQRKIRVLRDKLDKGITNYAAGDTFLATTHRMQALKIGNTAASHCLNSLQHGTRAQTEQLFDSAVELVENYRNHTNILDSREAHYLNIGTAMLLVSLLVDCATEIRPQYIMRLLRLAERDPSGQKPLRLEYLSLLLVVYALFQRDYPGWRLPPPLSPTSRAERAIDVITNYVGDSGPEMLSKASPAMINIGLLELLSDPEGYKLKDADITAITEAFYPIGKDDAYNIHTFPENSPPYTFSLVAKSLATMISKTPKVTESDSVVIGCLTVLNRTVIDQSAADTPLGEVYAFVIECALGLSALDPEAYGQNSALDLLRKFHDLSHREWVQRERLTDLTQEWARREKLTNLAQALDERDLFTRLKQTTGLAALTILNQTESTTLTNDDENFVIKLLAIGQAWLLINLAIGSEVTNDEDWRRHLNSLIGDESVWGSPDAINALEHGLARFYRDTFDADGMRRHSYFSTLLLSIDTYGLGGQEQGGEA